LLEVGDVRVTAVAENSPAERAGIMDGDTILEINDRPIRNLRDLSWNLQLNLGSEVTMLVERGQAQEAVYVVPRWNPPEGEGATGIEVELVGAYTISERYHFWEAIPMGGRRCIETMILFKNEITSWFIAGKAPQVAGPIGIAQLTGEVIKGGLDPLLQFTAFLSMNLAIINLLPIPALDGARISFVLLEGIRRGKRISPKREGLVHLIGFALLILLMVVVSYYDIMRIMSGEGFIR
jgi:regulator of sigma E protease